MTTLALQNERIRQQEKARTQTREIRVLLTKWFLAISFVAVVFLVTDTISAQRELAVEQYTHNQVVTQMR